VIEITNVALVAYFAIASAVAAVLFGLRDLLVGRKTKTPTLRELLRKIPSETTDEELGPVKKFDRWLERTLYLSGLNFSMNAAVLLWVFIALAVGGGIFVLTENIPLAVVAAIFAGVALIGYILWAKRRRLNAIQSQFPAAIDILARAVQAGESLEQAIELTADATKDPISSEFRRTAKHLELGLSLPAAMRSFSQRIGLLDVRILANTLTIYRETGGSLPTVLERLAAVIRDRMEYHRQLKAVTSSGRFSVLVVAALGPILFAYFFLLQPEYGSALWEDPIGRWMLAFAICSQLIGLIWVSRLLKSDY